MPVGYPVQGVEVLLLDENNQSVEAGKEGRITIRSAHLRQGFLPLDPVDQVRGHSGTVEGEDDRAEIQADGQPGHGLDPGAGRGPRRGDRCDAANRQIAGDRN